MSDRAERLRAELREEERRFDALLADGAFKDRQASLARCKELEEALSEAEAESLTGDGSPRP